MDNLEANIMDKSMRSVFVGNIPYEATEEKLKDIFGEVGQVLSFKLVFDRETGKPKGYGFCEYRDQETALSAMRNLNGYEIGGRNLRVDNACTEKSRMEMQNLLNQPPVENPYGEPVQAEKAPEAISKAVASLPPEQMFELMKQMKATIQNPQLAYALLQAQVVMKIIDPHTAASLLHPVNQVPATLMPGDKNVPVQVPINRDYQAPPVPVAPPRQEFQPVPAPIMPPVNSSVPVFSGQDIDLRALDPRGAIDPRLSRMADQDMRQLPSVQLSNPLPPIGENFQRETRNGPAAFPSDPRQAGRVDPRQKAAPPPVAAAPAQPPRPAASTASQSPVASASAMGANGAMPPGASDQEKHDNCPHLESFLEPFPFCRADQVRSPSVRARYHLLVEPTHVTTSGAILKQLIINEVHLCFGEKNAGVDYGFSFCSDIFWLVAKLRRNKRKNCLFRCPVIQTELILDFKGLTDTVYRGSHEPPQSKVSVPKSPSYRMPPLPPFVEPGIPGSTVPAFSSSAQLYTHSTKFPIERQITLSSTEKNFKIPILNDIKKRSKGAVIAPDAPPKRLTAWTYEEHMQPHQTYSEHAHAGLNQRTVQHSDGNMVYRASYVPEVEMYGNHSLARDNLPPIPSNEIPPESEIQQKTAQSVIYQTPQKYEAPRDQDDKAMKGSRGVTKTYHALKDIISGKFRGRDPEKAVSELNNITENVKNPMESKTRDVEVAQINGGQAYASPVAEPQQFNQQVIQQHNLQQQQPHQFYAQQLRSHQQQQQLHHFLPARPQAQGLRHRPDNQVAYQVHGNTPFMYSPSSQMRQASGFSNVENITQVHQTEYSNNGISMGFERRSAQQIERDNLKQKNLEARRTLSHPHLLLDTEGSDLHNGAVQQPVNIRRGSLGNILDANVNITNKIILNQEDKESDEGGFVNRIASRRSCTNVPADQKEVQGDNKGAATEHPPPEVKRRLENEGDRERASSNLDSGRGSAAYSSGRRPPLDDGTDTARTSPRGYDDPNDQENDSEWVDIVEKELRHILEPKLLELSMRNSNHGITMSTVSGSISSITPPLPPLSGGDNLSPTLTPKSTGKCKGSERDRNAHYEAYKGKIHPRDSMYESKMDKHSKKIDYNIALRGKQIFGLDSTDFTSTTTRSLDLESILDGQSDSDANLSVADTKAIRKQLEGLENMYSEVLKFLGVNKRTGGRYQPSDPRIHKKRQGSMSSLPTSSVSSVRRERRYVRGSSEDRRRGREPRATNRRFQRLEAHVVTLARSVAHLSSEMRTQHLVIQEIESVRQEVAALRAQTNMLNIRSQSSRPAVNAELPTLANPSRVKKLTKFFGDEPPLVRLFLRKLGYEKYANLFENEKIGMVELPYLCEERLQKMGIPLGPRLRIMQEAQISVYKDNTLCIV